MTTYLRTKLMNQLLKNFSYESVYDRMRYFDDNHIELEYHHLPIRKAMFGILTHLEELEYCPSCNELEMLENGNQGVLPCEDCRR